MAIMLERQVAILTSKGPSKGVAGAAGFIMLMIAISRLTGFLRETVVAKTFGRGIATDALYAAFTIPDMMYFLLIGGSLSSAFIPVFTEYLAKDRERDGWEAASTFINVSVCLLVFITLIGVASAPLLAPFVAYKIVGEHRQLLIQLIRIMFPAVFFTAMAGLQMGVLNSYRDFLSPTAGPIVYNIGIMLGTIFLGKEYGVFGMALGVVAGALGNVLLQIPFVMKRNNGYKPCIDLRNPGYQRMVRLMMPTLFGLGVAQINLVINQNLASGLSRGSITGLRYANRIMQLPLGIFAAGIAQAFFPTMTRQIAKGQTVAFKRTAELGVRAIIYITLPAAVGLIVLREPIIRLILEHGAFKPSDTAFTAVGLKYYSLGLVATSTVQILTRIFYSLNDTSTPVKTGIAMVILNFALNLTFLHFTDLGHGGLALAFSIDSTVNMAILLYILSGKIQGFGFPSIVGSFMKGLVSALAMGLAVSGIYRLLSQVDYPVYWHDAACLGFSILAGAGIYGAITALLKMEEFSYCVSLLRRK